MTAWVLLIWWGTAGYPQTATIDVYSQAQCDRVAIRVEEAIMNGRHLSGTVLHKCIERGEP